MQQDISSWEARNLSAKDCREPVDRFLSAYEFATEVAARAARIDPATAPKPDPRRTNTRDVWPRNHYEQMCHCSIASSISCGELLRNASHLDRWSARYSRSMEARKVCYGSSA